MMKTLKRNWLVASKSTWGIDEFWSKHSKLSFNGLLLTKVYNVWAKKVQRSYIWSHWGLMKKFEGKLTYAFKNYTKNLANFHRLKNSDFLLESKKVELHQNKSSKQQDRPGAMWKLYFILEINEKHN